MLIDNHLLNGTNYRTHNPVNAYTDRKDSTEIYGHKRHEIIHHLHGLHHFIVLAVPGSACLGHQL